MMAVHLIAIGFSLCLLAVLRVYLLLPSRYPQPPAKRACGETCSLGVFLGSGGHTAEVRTLLLTVDYGRYSPRTYVLCHGDTMSLNAIKALEESSKGSVSAYSILQLPRARKVGQPLFSTIFTTAITLLTTVYHTFILPLIKRPLEPWVDVLLVNGPGTCVVLVLVTWIRRFFGLSHSKVIYVESFARVKSLSLSAKLLKPFVDTFVVQWPEAGSETEAGSPAETGQVNYKGWLV